MVFTSQADQRWLRRMMEMFEDIVRETWFYQHILEQGRAQEREQALGEIRLILLDMVRVRFPDVMELAQQRANALHDSTLLREVIRKMTLASTAEEARRSLLEIPASDLLANQAQQGSADFHAGNPGI